MHVPVLMKEAVDLLNIKPDGIYVDCTFGAGGYSSAILRREVKHLISFDRDPYVQRFLTDFKSHANFTFIQDVFSTIAQHVKNADGIIADFGVSSMHLDQGERGFSFMHDGKLDMRMGGGKISAFDVVNDFSEEKLAKIIDEFGEETRARKIAKMIFSARKSGTIETTSQLAKVIMEAYGNPHRWKIHPATKTFQAIRIFINDELMEIKKLIESSIEILNHNGRLVCVSFHGLEDRIIKNAFAKNSAPKKKHNKYAVAQEVESFPLKLITDGVVVPSDDEIKNNTRSRSAKLRAAEKI